MKTLEDCLTALDNNREKLRTGELSMDDFFCELEVISDFARSIQMENE